MDNYSGLSVNALHIHARASDPIELDQHPGSSVRGAFFRALWRRFCVNRDVPACAECPLNLTCPVAELVAPLRDENPRGRDIPRPFVIEPPMTGEDTASRENALLTREATFSFGLTLIGTASMFVPYVVMAVQMMEREGIGRPLMANGGRRGRFHVEQIETVHPSGEMAQILYTRGETVVHAPTMAITTDWIAKRAMQIHGGRLTLQFLTPTRLIADGRLMHTPHLYVIIQRLLERLDALEIAYGDATPEVKRLERQERHHVINTQASAVRLIENATHWVDVRSYSARQRRATPIGGFIGSASYEGDISLPLRELLAWGEILHVGKNAVKGDGLFRVTT